MSPKSRRLGAAISWDGSSASRFDATKSTKWREATLRLAYHVDPSILHAYSVVG
jgi:hypothetical protein